MLTPGRITLAAAIAVLVSSSAFAQQDDSGADNLNAPNDLRCSGLAEMDEGSRAFAIYYIAGYHNGVRDAETIAVVGESAETAGDTQPAESSQPEGAAGPAGILPQLPLEAILSACAQSPDSRIADIVTAHAGASGQ